MKIINNYWRWPITVISILLIHVKCYSQFPKYDNIWLMPDYTRNIMVMSFHKRVDSLNVKLDSVKKYLYFGKTGAMISDKDGILKAYSNGCFINHAGYNIMENGDDINSGVNRHETCDADFYAAGEQGALFIPNPIDSLQYYMIHASTVIQYSPLKAWVDALRYSLIDMRYNNGLGKVIEKNKIIINDSTTLADIGAVKHSNNHDWWIVVKKYFVGSDDKFLLTDNGIKFINNQQIGDTSNRYEDGGGVVHIFSPNDGSKMVRYHPYDDGFYLYDFDRSSGFLSNFERIPVTDSLLKDGGACFSPSGRFLYIGTYWDLYQYDLKAVDVKSSEVHIAHYDGYRSLGIFRTMIGKMQWGPDCKIYVNCRNSMDALHVIHKPDEKGIACDFRQHDLKLPQTHSGTLPYFPNYRLGIAPVCDPELTVSIYQVPNMPEIIVYPNPAKDNIKLSFHESLIYRANLRIMNTAGQVIESTNIPSGSYEYLMNTTSWVGGIYFYTISFWDGTLATGKFVIE